MAKKSELTKEMEEALKKANVPQEKIEELREKGFEVKPLSADDLEAVSGGSYRLTRPFPDDFIVKGQTFEQGLTLVTTIYNVCGKDNAIDYLSTFYELSRETIHDCIITEDMMYTTQVIWSVWYNN